MKFYLLGILLLCSTVFAAEKVKINGKLYIAEGFDDNDLVELTVVGTLPNTCFKNPFYEIERKNYSYAIRLYAYYSPEFGNCRDVSIAYVETINFGMMYPGEYDLKLINHRNTESKNLLVKPATSQLMDEFLYGHVNGILESQTSRDIELVGINPVNCLVFEKMTATVQNSLIVLRPHFKEVGICKNRPTAFKIKYTVPFLANQPQGIMLHVRVMNGRSFNYLYQNRL